jgi:hypothetical protein
MAYESFHFYLANGLLRDARLFACSLQQQGYKAFLISKSAASCILLDKYLEKLTFFLPSPVQFRFMTARSYLLLPEGLECHAFSVIVDFKCKS